MIEWWGWVLIVIGVIAVGVLAQRRGWIDFRSNGRRGGSGGGLVGIGDEVFNPTRHEAQIELDRQTMLPAPAPIPGDEGPGGIRFEGDPDDGDGYRGSVRL
ncbi:MULTISPECIES: hypothetical protein [Microcella]|uniref:hypothetical protein n=1 Tax=Microcella TaxID=337004 RepID=UPI0015CF2D94|nr:MULTISPECIES: hypothetical protein [Microcella]QOD93780.1 hypothetical protein IE160_00595 [Chryseoglobus sp. 28M-23]